MKSNRGVTLYDIIIAVVILSLFVGIIGNLFYQIAYNTNLVKYNAIATYYAVKVAEDIDKLSYAEVNNAELSSYIASNYNLPDEFNINVDIQNYNQNKPDKQDILKIATIQVNYKCLNENKFYKIRKLKIKEF